MKKLLPLLLLAGLIATTPLTATDVLAKTPVAKHAAPQKLAAPAAGQKPAAAAAEQSCPEAEKEYTPPPQHWQHKELFGTYNMADVQRGFQVYKEVCSNCHSLKYLSYRDLAGLGYTPDQVKAFASQFTVPGAPDDNGQIADRPAIPADHFKSPFPNDQAARAANNGALPPDMSLLVKAREHGEDYIFALLNGYEAPPSCKPLLPGMNWNKYFPPHQIAMPKMLSDGQISFADGAPNTLEAEARDVVQFLAWASEPHLEQRKAMGFKILLFMLVFCAIMWKAKTEVWSDVK
jgi:ubiquinol-cytochrome c reductase cytochrome c1 subunit